MVFSILWNGVPFLFSFHLNVQQRCLSGQVCAFKRPFSFVFIIRSMKHRSYLQFAIISFGPSWFHAKNISYYMGSRWVFFLLFDLNFIYVLWKNPGLLQTKSGKFYHEFKQCSNVCSSNVAFHLMFYFPFYFPFFFFSSLSFSCLWRFN